MLKHIVMYKFKPENKGKEQQLVDKFLSMKGNIPTLLNVEAGKDILQTPRSFDVVLICDFNDENALKEYLDHPFHQNVREFVHSLVEKAHSVDYTV